MPTIRLTRGKVAIVSEEDYEYLNQFRWCCLKKGYAARNLSHKLGLRGMAYMHRDIMERMLGEPIPEGHEIDHANMDKLDNRRENLRLATRSQNRANQKRHRDSASQYKGVHFEKARGKWCFSVQAEGRRARVGGFDTEEEAARAYDAKAEEWFGEFARLNFPHLPD